MSGQDKYSTRDLSEAGHVYKQSKEIHIFKIYILLRLLLKENNSIKNIESYIFKDTRKIVRYLRIIYQL